MEREDVDLRSLFIRLSPEERGDWFLPTDEAARCCEVCQRTVQTWIQSGRVQALRVGKKYFVWRPSLEDMIETDF